MGTSFIKIVPRFPSTLCSTVSYAELGFDIDSTMDPSSVWIIYHFKRVHYMKLQEDNIFLRYCLCNCSTMIVLCSVISM